MSFYFLPTVETANDILANGEGRGGNGEYEIWESLKPLLQTAGLNVAFYDSWAQAHPTIVGWGENQSEVVPSFGKYVKAQGYDIGIRSFKGDQTEYRVFKNGRATNVYMLAANNSQEFDFASKVFSSWAGGIAMAGLTAPGVFSEGTSMFDDFDVQLPDDSFEGFGFSSGEADVAFSDAEVVDFGFPTNPSDIRDAVPVDGVIPGSDGAYPDGINIGSTPEVSTNDFGTQFEPAFGDESIKTAVKGVKLAETVAGATKGAPSPQRATGGASGVKQQAGGSNDILASFGQAFQTVGAVAASISGTAAQKTTAIPRTYQGQLDPTKNTIAGVSTNTLLLIAAGLIGVAFILKKGGI